LASFGTSPDTPGIREEVERIVREEVGSYGGIIAAGTVAQSDVCINGMFLTYACHIGVPEERLATVADFVLGQVMEDGGFNCRRNRSGAAAHPGKVHVALERAGSPSRWVTLMALRVLDRYGEAFGRGGTTVAASVDDRA
jgi:hypothetical protein